MVDDTWSIRHIYREFNQAADSLSNEAIDVGSWESAGWWWETGTEEPQGSVKQEQWVTWKWNNKGIAPEQGQ